MSANDVILLQDMLEKSRRETAGLSPSEQEAFFVSNHYLNAFRPSHDDLLSGIVDGAGDGGIDAMYVFANQYCIRDDLNIEAMGRAGQLDLFFIQVKNTAGLGETPLDKLILNLPRLLDFARNDQDLAAEFNPKVIEISRRFLDLYRRMQMPHLRIFVCVAALRADSIHHNVAQKGKRLEESLLRCFANCEPVVHVYDAADIAATARLRPPVQVELSLAENPISTDMSGGFVGLVKLRDYQTFITDESGNLDATLFEANVRDYESSSSVNRAIQETLGEVESNVDFWWLNNGVTVVADKVQSAGKLLKLESPQIVNGLQTSNEIYRRGIEFGHNDDRGLLVKVIQADKDPVRDRIIRATNSQTSLAPSALRATDKVQRDIEQYFESKGLYYERRKNYYSNRQIPLASLVSIEQLGQAVLGSLVLAPHVARGEVSRIFQDDIYRKVFQADHPLEAFYTSIKIVRTCEDFLRRNRLTSGQVEDFLFHLSMAASMALTRKSAPRAKDLVESLATPSDEMLKRLLPIVQKTFAKIARQRNEVLFDKLAKDADSTRALNQAMTRYLRSSSSASRST